MPLHTYKTEQNGVELMAEKTVSKHLSNLEKTFAKDNPI